MTNDITIYAAEHSPGMVGESFATDLTEDVVVSYAPLWFNPLPRNDRIHFCSIAIHLLTTENLDHGEELDTSQRWSISKNPWNLCSCAGCQHNGGAVGIAGTRTLTSLHRTQKRFHNENVPFLSITCFGRRESGIGAQNTVDRLFKRRICMSEPTDRRIRRRANIADANTLSRNQWCITTASINYHARAVHDHHDGELNETAQDPRIEALLLQRIHLKSQVHLCPSLQ